MRVTKAKGIVRNHNRPQVGGNWYVDWIICCVWLLWVSEHILKSNRLFNYNSAMLLSVNADMLSFMCAVNAVWLVCLQWSVIDELYHVLYYDMISGVHTSSSAFIKSLCIDFYATSLCCVIGVSILDTNVKPTLYNSLLVCWCSVCISSVCFVILL